MKTTQEKYQISRNVYFKFVDSLSFSKEEISSRTPLVIAGFIQWVAFIKNNKALKDTTITGYINALKEYYREEVGADNNWQRFMEPNINGSEMFNDIDVEESSQLTEGIDEINVSQSSSNSNANNMTQSFAQEISSVDFIQDTRDTKGDPFKSLFLKKFIKANSRELKRIDDDQKSA